MFFKFSSEKSLTSAGKTIDGAFLAVTRYPYVLIPLVELGLKCLPVNGNKVKLAIDIDNQPNL